MRLAAIIRRCAVCPPGGAAFIAATAMLLAPHRAPGPGRVPDVEVCSPGNRRAARRREGGRAFVDSLRRQTKRNVNAYGSTTRGQGLPGRHNGANDASGHVQQMASNCPNTKMVLGGYSQGAAVIDIVTAAPLPGLGFQQPLPGNAANHVAASPCSGIRRAGRRVDGRTEPEFRRQDDRLVQPG